MISNQVIRDGSQLSNWFGNTTFLTPVEQQNLFDATTLKQTLLKAFGDFKWTAVNTFAEIRNVDADIILMQPETVTDGATSTASFLSHRVQNVSGHILTPVKQCLHTGVQQLVKTGRGTVSPKYCFDGHQPENIAHIFSALQRRTPLVFEWAGCIGEGLAVFSVARVTERQTLYNGETIEHYLMMRNGLDGSMIIGQQSSLPGCCNAYSTWLSKGTSTLRFTHHHGVDVDEVIQHLADKLKFDFEHVTAQALRMANCWISSVDTVKYFERVLLSQSAGRYGGKVEKFEDIPTRDKGGKVLPHRAAFQRDLATLQACDSSGNGQMDRRGVHRAFHAVTFWANHITSNRGGVAAVTERNAKQMMPGGNRDKLINTAYDLAMQIAEAA